MTSSDERRGFQRLALSRPLDGTFGDLPVRLLDVSATGALIDLSDDLPPGTRGALRFSWRNEDVEISCEVVRRQDGRTALQFHDSCPALNRLLALSAKEVLLAHLANLDGDRDSNRVGDETMTAFSAGNVLGASGYLKCTLTPSGWTRRRALLPEQPEDGFTVSASTPPEQIDILCETYEVGDAEGRRLTRLLAELSVARRKE